MFESLGEKFETLWRKLQGQGRITERNIEEALRDVRLALLEADVNVAVVRDFVEAVKKDALGAGGAAQPHARAALHQARAARAVSGCWATSPSRSTWAARHPWS